MIVLTRLNGPTFALNPDLIERAESTPDTVLTLIDGSKYLVAEPLAEVIARIRWFRASLIAAAGVFDTVLPEPAPHPSSSASENLDGATLNIVPINRGS
ncbi:MAG TPA: flagellar FlbD family protein [Candidatus Nanopelagicaceae bacterium]|nr:flagellar FlbD family protein [Candidatus Nanopelagicaceae bacterium]